MFLTLRSRRQLGFEREQFIDGSDEEDPSPISAVADSPAAGVDSNAGPTSVESTASALTRPLPPAIANTDTTDDSLLVNFFSQSNLAVVKLKVGLDDKIHCLETKQKEPKIKRPQEEQRSPPIWIERRTEFPVPTEDHFTKNEQLSWGRGLRCAGLTPNPHVNGFHGTRGQVEYQTPEFTPAAREMVFLRSEEDFHHTPPRLSNKSHANPLDLDGRRNRSYVGLGGERTALASQTATKYEKGSQDYRNWPPS
ncbi:hypothetical protein BDK51DRAFT_34644 [Blyttiomyces helicus]|uniref:Uncharacterized protein n=1 Tax=Blyttiomyces helicus TaxID=388810 RepID=A0A4P9WMS4_9FUNG|nr:hypothetical protein BDK51DRAFT_34644 [Blyttiomyces helicus]|eukprot:RKO94224.1 hypothetical protein BDK51DRAFT_34644 [Blyttiomyces helicus]